MSKQYAELRPTNGCDRLVSLEHPIKYQQFSSLSVITAPMLLNKGQPNFARYLVISWAGTLYTFLWAVAPNGILPGAKLWVQVFRSPILAALLHAFNRVHYLYLAGWHQHQHSCSVWMSNEFKWQ